MHVVLDQIQNMWQRIREEKRICIGSEKKGDRRVHSVVNSLCFNATAQLKGIARAGGRGLFES